MNWKSLTVCLIIGIAMMPVASSYEVTPLRHQLSVSEGRTSGLFTITNKRAAELPIEIVVLRRVYDENGEQSLVPDEENFIVFPPQTLIGPGRSSAVRFQYIGDPDMAISEGYVMEVREVPVDIDGFTGFKFVYNFGVAVYVRAPDAEADSRVVASSVADDVLTIDFVNDGRNFSRLSNDRLTVEVGGKRVVIEGQELSSRLENPVLPPQSPRRIELDVSSFDLPEGPAATVLRERPD